MVLNYIVLVSGEKEGNDIEIVKVYSELINLFCLANLDIPNKESISVDKVVSQID